MVENHRHPHRLDEMPVGAAETDGGRERGGKARGASESGPLSIFFKAELPNMTWFWLRRTTRVRLDLSFNRHLQCYKFGHKLGQNFPYMFWIHDWHDITDLCAHCYFLLLFCRSIYNILY